jgi:hypothetical protein
MKKNLLLFALALLLTLLAGCASTPQNSVVVTPPAAPKPPRPEVMDKPTPAPLSFLNRLSAIFDSLQPTPTK